MTRRCTPDLVNGLKTAFKRVVADLGGLEAAASCTRVGKSHLHEYGNIESPEKLPPADVVLDLEAIAGQPHVTAALAAAQGFELLKLDTRPHHELVASLVRISDDNGRLFSNAVRMLRGAPFTAQERAVLLYDLNDVMAAAREARAALLEDAP